MKQPSTSRRLLAATSVLVTLAATSLLSAAPAAAKTAPTPGPSALSIAVGPTSECDAVLGQLVANCGFESGDLTGWTAANGERFTAVQESGPDGVHSGTYLLVTGEVGTPLTLSQVLATTTGDTYQVRLYLDAYGEGDGVSFDATLDNGGATTLLTLSAGTVGWTEHSSNFTAVGESVTLTFTAQNDPGYWYLDDVSVYEQVAPTVNTSPTNQTVADGSTATFTAGASGAYTPTVQWQVLTDSGGAWADVEGATSDTLSFTASYAMNGYQYRAVYTNDAGTAPSDPATLTVTAATAPTVTTQPDSQTVTAGNTATFTAAASGDPAPTVQWQVLTDSGSTWADVEGATSDTLSFTASYAMNGYQYRAVYTNTVDTATSNAATLTVDALAPTVTTQPDNQTVTAGNSASFTAGASGDPAPTVQWQVLTDSGGTWADVEGATSDTLSFTASYAMNGYQYRAVYTNAADTATSNAATLTVTAGPATVTGLTAVSSKGSVTVTFSGAGNPVPTLFQCMLPVGKKTPTWILCESGDTIKSSAKTVSVRASNTNGVEWGTASTANVTK